ncbi:PAS domain S-box-containing protein/diguanylate cyclase (GGDEF)-like protein [Sulfurirhabdus autotrophica]|uniref:PAS domain S-box-containing protein/diguanylate cyclase (GGDEF)-like protein n=1 Tax=Sulfurirhabdus autotrophica TaxID=1706046 RepID=A0A4R3YFE5_9PROT|nr:PAS domain S-box-containing protein/diguanylate cyclase (GGDEF)-like protein [Sulfurirhabdus autotrophica]
MALIKRVSDAALDGAAAKKTGLLSADYWKWYEGEGSARIKELNHPELTAEWARLGKLHTQFLNAANSCVKAAADGDKIHVSQGLERVFELSSELMGLLVSASLSELTAAVSDHEHKLAMRHERDFMDAAQIGRFVVRLSDNVLLEADNNFLNFLGYVCEQTEGSEIKKFLDAKSYQRLLGSISEKEPNGRSNIHFKHANGQKVPMLVISYPDENAEGKVLRCFAANLSEIEGEIQQRRLLSAAVEVSDQAVLICNDHQEVVYVNPAFSQLTGYSAEEAIGKNPRFLQGKDTSQATRIVLRETLAAGRKAHVEMLNYTKEGLRFWIDLSIVPVANDSGDITHFVAIQHDITERKAAEQAIARIALEDRLTGLPNRRAAENRLETDWNRARRTDSEFAIAIVDIDRFKLVNDQHGHHVGDQALKHVADLMATCLRGGDWIARWGGEEFLLCFHGMDGRGAHNAAERVRKLVKANPLKMPLGEIPLTISMGLSMYNQKHENIDSLLAQADALLYEAKHSGRDKVLCSGSANSNKNSVIWEGSQVQGALHDGRVIPVFQPIVNLCTGKIVADEALARIRNADNSLVPAASFIQASESLHLVASIDKMVSVSAMNRCARAMKVGGEGLGLAHFINLSHQFLANVEQVDTLLEHAKGFCGDNCDQKGNAKPLVIEITERQSGDILTLKKNLKPLTDFGIRLALDDFGSGNSSFLYLAELPVDFLKIEGWMVGRIIQDKRVRQLVESIVSTARNFNVITIAECVEDAETARILCEIGVDWAQGYYFAKPEIDDVWDN